MFQISWEFGHPFSALLYGIARLDSRERDRVVMFDFVLLYHRNSKRTHVEVFRIRRDIFNLHDTVKVNAVLEEPL